MGKDLKGSCTNLSMRGPMVENVSQSMESDMVNLKRYHDLMVKSKGVFCFFRMITLYALF